MWKDSDSNDLRDTIGELRLRHGPKWGYYALAQVLPPWMPHEVVAKAECGVCELAVAEEVALKDAIRKVLSKE